MTNFATARAADAASFADGEIREVVVKDEFFLALTAGVGVEFLDVFARTQSAEGERLRFAALENGGAVRSREQADFGMDRANIIETTAIKPLIVVHDQIANGFFLDVIKGVFEDEFGDLLFAEFFYQFFADFVSQRGNG